MEKWFFDSEERNYEVAKGTKKLFYVSLMDKCFDYRMTLNCNFANYIQMDEQEKVLGSTVNFSSKTRLQFDSNVWRFTKHNDQNIDCGEEESDDL